MTNNITPDKLMHVSLLLDAALGKERRKYKATPVEPDMWKKYKMALAWGYVIAGYLLIEQGFKAVLCAHDINPPKTHALYDLFRKLPKDDQDVLRMFYDDFLRVFPDMDPPPPKTLDRFLENLDGRRDNQGQHIGLSNWLYFFTEERDHASMPLMNIDVMHEIMYGCVQLIAPERREDFKSHMSKSTYSWRFRQRRLNVEKIWLLLRSRMNPPYKGQEDDRIEMLWGPDYANRYDYMMFKGGQIKEFFAPLPNTEEPGLPVVDKRSELIPLIQQKAYAV